MCVCVCCVIGEGGRFQLLIVYLNDVERKTMAVGPDVPDSLLWVCLQGLTPGSLNFIFFHLCSPTGCNAIPSVTRFYSASA